MDKWEEKLRREQERLARQQHRWERHQDKWQRNQDKWQRQIDKLSRPDAHWDHHHHGPGHAVFVGGIIVGIGAVLLLSNLGVLQLQNVWQFWPVILIAFGLSRIVDCRGFSGIIIGGAMAGFGALLLLQNLNIWRFDWNVIWPIALIVWGLSVLLKPGHWNRNWTGGPGGPPPGAAEPPPGDPSGTPSGMPSGSPSGTASDTFGASAGTQWHPSGNPGNGYPGSAPGGYGKPILDLVAIFGGGRRVVDSQAFRGGEITAIFGGYQIDLRPAAIAPDQTALIEATAVFGGIEIIVPRNWYVDARGAGIFGGFTDETRPPLPQEVTHAQRLVVTGAGVFGGVVIKN